MRVAGVAESSIRSSVGPHADVAYRRSPEKAPVALTSAVSRVYEKAASPSLAARLIAPATARASSGGTAFPTCI